jgi:hypothetical protein
MKEQTEQKDLIVSFLSKYKRFNRSIVGNETKTKNFSVAYGFEKGDVFGYLDIVKEKVVGRLKINPKYFGLQKYSSICRNFTGKHRIGSWKDITEIDINSEKDFDLYIQVFEIARKFNERY